MLTWNSKTARRARCLSLYLDRELLHDGPDAVDWFGAVQAQDINSALWSLGLRTKMSRDQLEAQYQQGLMVRTWAMRGTIHLVPPEDAGWMSKLTSSRTLPSYTTSLHNAGIPKEALKKARTLICDDLREGNTRTREQALTLLAGEGIPTQAPGGYLLLCVLSMEGHIGLGHDTAGSQTLVTLEHPNQRTLGKNDALTELTWRYFRSHGPATVHDYAGWSGLTVSDARKGVNANQGRITPVLVDDTIMYASTHLVELLAFSPTLKPAPARALPGFDEFLLGYKNRDLLLEPGHMKHVVPGSNGVFKATIIADGIVAGTWERKPRKHHTEVTVHPVREISNRAKAGLAAQLRAWGRWNGQPVTITWDEN